MLWKIDFELRPAPYQGFVHLPSNNGLVTIIVSAVLIIIKGFCSLSQWTTDKDVRPLTMCGTAAVVVVRYLGYNDTHTEIFPGILTKQQSGVRVMSCDNGCLPSWPTYPHLINVSSSPPTPVVRDPSPRAIRVRTCLGERALNGDRNNHPLPFTVL